MNQYPAILNLANRVYSDYKSTNFDQAQFTEIATSHLRTYNDYQSLSPNRIIDWIGNQKLPTQLQANQFTMAFGSPPVTLFYCDHFVVDLYFWGLSSTDIHDHDFSGAFKVIMGETMQVCYDHENIFSICEGIVSGLLTANSIEIIDSADVVVPILSGSDFLHHTTHLANPTITLCVRTLTAKLDHQYGYYPTGLARSMNLTHSSHRLYFDMLRPLVFTTDPRAIDFLSREMQSMAPLDIIDTILIFFNLTNNISSTLILLNNVSVPSLRKHLIKLVHFYHNNTPPSYETLSREQIVEYELKKLRWNECN